MHLELAATAPVSERSALLRSCICPMHSKLAATPVFQAQCRRYPAVASARCTQNSLQPSKPSSSRAVAKLHLLDALKTHCNGSRTPMPARLSGCICSMHSKLTATRPCPKLEENPQRCICSMHSKLAATAISSWRQPHATVASARCTQNSLLH